MKEKPRIDVVVRAKDGHAMTNRCLDSIKISKEGSDAIRVVLVDDGSEPAMSMSDCADVVLRHESPQGAVSATNTGIGWCMENDPAGFIVVLDNDTVMPLGDGDLWQRWVDAFTDERVGACGASTNAANPPQHVLSVPQTYTANWNQEDGTLGGIKDNPEVPTLVSFAVMFRRECLEDCGAWDTRYNPGNYEDTDYAMHMRTRGWQIKVAQSIYIHHDCHQTFGSNLSELLRANQLKFVQKWGPGRLWDMGFMDDKTMSAMLQSKAGGGRA